MFAAICHLRLSRIAVVNSIGSVESDVNEVYCIYFYCK